MEILFFLFVLVIIVILAIAVHTSRVGIEIENLTINTEANKGDKINKESKIYVYLVLFGKIKLFKKDVKIEDLKFADGEVIDAKWVTIEEFLQIKENSEMISTIDFGREEYDLALEKLSI